MTGRADPAKPLADSQPSPFPSHVRDDFDEWLRVPVASMSEDPRIEVRRGQPAEFEQIFDLVDEAFASKRSRALSDWAYRRNPYGLARCWISVERATGRLVGAAVNWPWPLAHGMCPLAAAQGGDAAVARGWQHQGIHANAGRVRESHPWTRSVVNFGWPNSGSVRRIHKNAKASRLVGVLPRRMLVLRARSLLVARGLPWPLPALGARALDPLVGAWTSLVLGARRGERVEPVRRFDAAFDAVTQRCMVWDGYWSPHDAAFLNWRYLSDPVREHVALSLTQGATLVGYSVVRLHQGKARLMELVAPRDQPHAARALLGHVIKVARDAGCSHLEVVASTAWRYWRLLSAVGSVKLPAMVTMYAYCLREDAPGVQTLGNWQLLGGDLDPLGS